MVTFPDVYIDDLPEQAASSKQQAASSKQQAMIAKVKI
jgi:hypothetical protein